MAQNTTAADDGTDELPRTTDDYPNTIEGGDYDGAVLIGVLDYDTAEYYDADLDKVATFRLMADHVPEIDIESQTGRDLKWLAEEPLDGMSVEDHIRATEREFADYDGLASPYDE